ncbi:hypothetical protein [Sphingomonas colocasiae]|uniref:Uncharacterized protein n=1 Tax=Sphingomonas colocasiae TaxID=1848973 RepID=A0ABS7PLL4_9SPHN|nr:hypothetical protein [Sphingomonas colocasiae]MBY8820964.1 hypothetical protein [Sphingomonas colocasiae]
MFRRIKRLFVIKTRFEACLIIYALATGAMQRGKAYLVQYPGYGGWLLCLACTGAVFMAGAMIFDALALKRAAESAGAPPPEPAMP